MKPTGQLNPNEMTCPHCHHPLDVSVIQLENGQYQEVLQCIHCWISELIQNRIPIYRHSTGIDYEQLLLIDYHRAMDALIQ